MLRVQLRDSENGLCNGNSRLQCEPAKMISEDPVRVVCWAGSEKAGISFDSSMQDGMIVQYHTVCLNLNKLPNPSGDDEKSCRKWGNCNL